MSFNAISFIKYEISDLQETYGHDMSAKEKAEYMSYAKTIQMLYVNADTEKLDKIACDNENYPACVQRCADEALHELIMMENMKEPY
jgi:hypothetical protein